MTPQEKAVPTAPQPGAALVVARWNSWVRLYWPETGQIEWVDLRETKFENLSAAATSGPTTAP